MLVRDSISAADRDLMKRLTIVLAIIFALTAVFSFLNAMYARKFSDVTGQAQWIWAQHVMNANEPVAFFAARDFDLPATRVYAHLKIVGDPEYTLWVNGREIAGRRLTGERNLDLYDISDAVRTGRNRIVVAVRAPHGGGGLLASIDLSGETENWVVTDGRWKIYRRWTPALLLADPPALAWEEPMLIGEPPVGRWNYLTPVRTALVQLPATSLAPRDRFDMIAFIPTIRTRAGIAVAVADRERATVFDFGFTRGQLRVSVPGDRFTSRAVQVRFANSKSELGRIEWNLRPVVFAPGEHVVTTSEPHSFRYAMVFARDARAEVVN